MTSPRTRLILHVLTAVISTSVCSGVCFHATLFGDNCQYTCNCHDDPNELPCNLSPDPCSGRCMDDWFGPACQYVSSEFAPSSGQSSLPWLTDNDDRTCNDGRVQSVSVALDSPHPLTWVRVVVTDAEHLHDAFQLGYRIDGSAGGVSSCPEAQAAIVNDRTLDIWCPTSEAVSDIVLFGPVVGALCTLTISGGRNVAIRQSPVQSDNMNRWVSGGPVDGSPRSPSAPLGEYTRVCNILAGSYWGVRWWNLTFSLPVHITRFVLYDRDGPGREECCKNALIGFRLTALEENSTTEVFSYTDPGPASQAVYTVVPSPVLTQAVKEIRLDKTDGSYFLTPCELMAFGDTACEPGYFGRECEHECNCAGGGRCFVSTGGCPSGCAPGYTGEDCYTPCPNGTYGAICGKSCSQHCAGPDNACNFTDDSCVFGCDLGYQPPTCVEACPSGTYGPGCAETCSVHCAGRHHACSHLDGTCYLGCQPGYVPPLCHTACPSGKYGPACTQTCSVHCAGPDFACSFTDGACYLGCDEGYQPPLCEKGYNERTERQASGGSGENASGENTSGGNVGAAVGGAVAAIVLALAVVAAVVVWRRRRTVHRADGEQTGQTADDTETSEATTQSGHSWEIPMAWIPHPGASSTDVPQTRAHGHNVHPALPSHNSRGSISRAGTAQDDHYDEAYVALDEIYLTPIE